MLNIENLSFSYKKESPLFLDFSWNFDSGERWAVIGPSGCGKTTLLYLLAGLRLPSAGKITRNSGISSGHKILSGLILQDYGLLPWATALENVALGLKIQGVASKTAALTAGKWLSDLGLEPVSHHYPAELSGGQRQRVAIARTLALEAEMILMDEPFASLDTLTREDLLNLCLGLWRKLQPTMMLVTHNIEEAVYWGSRILVLGHPPHTRPDIVMNPGSGSPEYRQSPDFNALCRHLRSLLEKSLVNGKTGKNNE
jgi:ABC-type nitrate/sulfonate/bicarbonate transport system ATPase subunit